MRNIIDRDCYLAHYVKSQAEIRRLPIYEVDGSCPLDEMTVLVENYVEPYIMKRLGQMEHL